MSGPNPETSNSLPPEVQEFQRSANRVMNDFTFQVHGGFLPTKEGDITYNSLSAALSRVSTIAAEEPSVLALLRAVNQSNGTESHVNGNETFNRATETPEFALLKLFGAAEPRRVAEINPAPEVVEKPEYPERVARLGHQILVDGHVVRGHIGPGRREVTTSSGILRTRGTPRISL